MKLHEPQSAGVLPDSVPAQRREGRASEGAIRGLEAVLAEVPLLQGLAPEYLALMAGCASNVRFDAGEYVYREGECAERFYVIRHGRVALDVFVPQRGPTTIQTVERGEMLGWSWLVPPYRWVFDARALELTRAIAMDGPCLRKKCEEDPRLGYELMRRIAQVFAERLQATRLQLLDVYSCHVGSQ